MFLSLDFVYVPTADVSATAARYVEDFGAELLWNVIGMGTRVACLRVSESGPAVGGTGEIRELEIPQGPCASFRAEGGQRYAIYELIRPGVEEHFAGRFDD